MDGSCEEEGPEVVASRIPPIVQSIDSSSQNQLAIYMILACLVLERIAFYSIAASLTVSLDKNFLEWHDANILTAEFIFTGKNVFEFF